MQSVMLDFSVGAGQRPAVRWPATALPAARSSPPRHWGFPLKTNLDALRGERVLAVVDADNFDFSVQRAGRRVLYAALLGQLRSLAPVVFPVAVLTSDAADVERVQRLRQAGWRTIVIPREVVPAGSATRVVGNADADLAFELGVLSAVANASAVLLATGDGDLAIACSRGLRRSCGRCPVAVHSLAVPGANSLRLTQRRELFDSAILLGQDLLDARSQNPLF